MIIAGIVLYNPNIDRLKENIEATIKQVDKIVLVDNGSKNISDIELLIYQQENMILKKNTSNLGVAAALNQLLSYAIDHEEEWLLTLDQDSVIADEYVKKLLNGGEYCNIALLAPNILDRNDTGHELLSGEGMAKIEECITSGAMMNVCVCKKVGWFDEKMFIDYVDFEYCYRVRKCGYDILRNNDVVLLHQLGDGYVASFLWKKFMVTNHPPFRHYYLVRNSVYLVKKHRWITRGGWAILREFFIVIRHEKNCVSKLKCMLKGIWDGIYL